MIRLPPPLHLRWRRRRLLWAAFRSRHALRAMQDRSAALPPGVVAVSCVRNEIDRLPWFLRHHRALGVSHFLFVDNGSDDGTAQYLADQPDTSVWVTQAGYRAARFGMDWLTWLQMRHLHGRWSLTLDADELLVYDGMDRHALPDLTALLQRRGQQAFGALMLDLYPQGPIGTGRYEPDTDPALVLPGFDAGPYRAARQRPAGNLWVQGGARERAFFASDPARSPTLNKLPLVRWNRGFAYTNSTHAALPPRLNRAYDGPADRRPCGVLLHTKFLPGIVARSAQEKARQQHFTRPEAFDGYYDAIGRKPTLWYDETRRYDGPKSLIEAGLMPPIAWL
ncbi:MAG: glycosyltransferase family 2 protein [Roseivivax sp.]|nr:glycosyltransferase family 2 protein [Roseivivax sp.]